MQFTDYLHTVVVKGIRIILYLYLQSYILVKPDQVIKVHKNEKVWDV